MTTDPMFAAQWQSHGHRCSADEAPTVYHLSVLATPGRAPFVWTDPALAHEQAPDPTATQPMEARLRPNVAGSAEERPLTDPAD